MAHLTHPELERSHAASLSPPDLLQEIAILPSDVATHAARVARVQLVKVKVAQEILRQDRRVGAALDRRVQETGVTEVVEPCHAFLN